MAREAKELPGPAVYDVLEGDALDVTTTPFGRVGRLFSAEGIEAVWVEKKAESIDPGWFSQDTVDLLLVLRGKLRIEFEDGRLTDMILEPGQLLVLPPNTPCRAYRWPREAIEATIFLAVYPKFSSVPAEDRQAPRTHGPRDA